MRHSLHSHIIYLEIKIQSFRDLLTRSHLTGDEIESLKAQISHAELALEHYRQAYELELSISSPETPDGPESKSSGGSGAAEKGNAEKTNKGRAAIAARARKKARVGVLPGFAELGHACVGVR
jgi:hypothetical protein